MPMKFSIVTAYSLIMSYFIKFIILMEAECRCVNGIRCKQSGMFWTERGVAAVMALRSLNAGNRQNSFWQAARHVSRAA